MLSRILVFKLRFSVSVVAVRAERALFALAIETTHYCLVLSRVWCCQPSRSCFWSSSWRIYCLPWFSCMLSRLDLLCGRRKCLEDLLVKIWAMVRLLLSHLAAPVVCPACGYFENNFVPSRIIITSGLGNFCGWRQARHGIIWAGTGAHTLWWEATIVCICFQVTGSSGRRRRVVIRGVATGTCGSLSCVTWKTSTWIFICCCEAFRFACAQVLHHLCILLWVSIGLWKHMAILFVDSHEELGALGSVVKFASHLTFTLLLYD